MSETVLVTGGTGYVAGWATVALLESGYTVRATVRSSSKEKAVREAVASVVDPEDGLSFAHADLVKDDGWDAAMQGVVFVLHVASPLGDESSKDPNALIVPARDGALRVLGAATRAGVRRVVMTSAANAASPTSYSSEGVTDETLWTVDSPSQPAYRRSKTLAEKAAWDFMASHDGPTQLTTVFPAPCSARSSPPTMSALPRSSSGCSKAECPEHRRSASKSSTCATSSTCTSAP